MSSTLRIALALFSIGAASPAAQDAMGPVRELYASAEYEEALSALDRLKATASADGLLEIDRYRALCLIALGQSTEADRVIETIVRAEPLYQPGAAEAGPRVRAAFTAVRRRVLPGVVRVLYANAKAAFDRKAFPEAVEGLEHTMRVLDKMDEGSELSDLRLLASGFLDLSRASLPPAAPAVSSPAAVNANPQMAATPSPVAPATTAVAIRQDVPRPPFFLGMTSGEYRGTVEVEIDESGNVVSTRMIQSVHSLYDKLLLAAARDWKYQPALVGGNPTKSRKRVDVVLRP